MVNNFNISPREIKRCQTTSKPLQYLNLINSYSAAELFSTQKVVSSSLSFYYCDDYDCKEKDRRLLFLYLNEKNLITETSCPAVPQELR